MKKTVVELECSRCHRKEYVPASEATQETSPALVILLDGKEVAKFEDLCAPCKEALGGYLEQICKPMEKKSPNRKKKDATELLEAIADAKRGTGTLHNGEGAKEKGPKPHPPVVTRSP
jgi:hypothetical protein